MWFNPRPNRTLLSVSNNDQMIRSYVLISYVISEFEISWSFQKAIIRNYVAWDLDSMREKSNRSKMIWNRIGQTGTHVDLVSGIMNGQSMDDVLLGIKVSPFAQLS